MSAVHQQLLGEGRRVAWVRLCRLLGVARSTLYYQSCPPRRNEAVDGLVFGSRQYVALARDYGLTQEYIAPHTPEQNGLCERFIRTFKEECVWLHTFPSIADAKTQIAAFINYYNTQRYHQALRYVTPFQHHQNLCRQAA